MMMKEDILEIGTCFLHHNAGVRIVGISKRENTVICILERLTGSFTEPTVTQIFKKTADGMVSMPCCSGFQK